MQEKRRVRFSARANRELEVIRDYYSQISPELESNLRSDIESLLKLVLEWPNLARADRDLRIIPLRRFPYHVRYQVRGDIITIASIRHQKRQDPDA